MVSTCNRVEVYADVGKFHGGVSAISELLARHAGVDLAQLTKHLYVHYEERAVHHLFAVSCGLDSMVAGEGQILGQVRQALKYSHELGTLGRPLADLGTACPARGQARAQRDRDRPGGGEHGERRHRSRRPQAAPGRAAHDQARPLAAARTLVVGAGSMSALAATTAARAGASRHRDREPHPGERAAAGRVGAGSTAGLAELPRLIAEADLVISCTGAAGNGDHGGDWRGMRSPPALAPAGGGPPGQRVVHCFIDLALPRDVDPAVDGLPGAVVIGLDDIGAASRAGVPGTDAAVPHDEDIAAVRRIVAEEVAAHASAVHAARVTPTVVALRAKAAKVVDAELTRLAGRLVGTASHELDEIAQAMRRVVDKLLHAPTVRVKELAGSPGGDCVCRGAARAFRPRPEGGGGRNPRGRRSGRRFDGRRTVKRAALRLGTRRSLMARTQAGQVAQMITARTGLPVDLVGVTTFGDVSKADLASIGGTGVFVNALRERLLAGEVDHRGAFAQRPADGSARRHRHCRGAAARRSTGRPGRAARRQTGRPAPGRTRGDGVDAPCRAASRPPP